VNNGPERLEATIMVDPMGQLGRLDQNVYGHFLESAFFGNVEGGVFDEGSPRSLSGPGPTRGLRADVADLCSQLGVPVVRWPGGNFTSAYHWAVARFTVPARPVRTLRLAACRVLVKLIRSGSRSLWSAPAWMSVRKA